MKYKAIVFDLDHTLFSRFETLYEATIKGESVPFRDDMSREEAAKAWIAIDGRYNHLGWDELFRIMKEQGILKPEVSSRKILYLDYVSPLFKQFAVPFPFVIPMLAQFRSEGYKLGLITNGYHDIQDKKIHLLGLENSFDEILIGEDAPKQKPDPIIFKVMAERLGIDPSEMLYVGDNPINDVNASRQAGCTPVWVRTIPYWMDQFERAPYEIDSVKELPELIRRIEQET